MQEPGTDSDARPMGVALGVTSTKVCPAKPREQSNPRGWKLRLTFALCSQVGGFDTYSMLPSPALRRLASVNSPSSHSLRRPTLDGDAGGDGDEAQVEAPNPAPCPCSRPPLPCLPQPGLTC